MSEAEINGKPASLAAAAERSAEILTQARMPLFAGLGTDVAGARASILLAERLRGAYDHMYSSQIFADLDVVRQAGLMITTPSEARLRADVLLFVGKTPPDVWPAMIEWLAPYNNPPLDIASTPRKLLSIAPTRGAPKIDGLAIETLDAPDLHTTLAALRARLTGKSLRSTKNTLRKLDEFVEILKNAHFGVAVWCSESEGLDSLAIEMLHGLLLDLNKTTRFSGLPLGPPRAGANASGVLQTSGWMTGFPMRTSFGRGFPEHDSWQFDAERLVDSGEADAALWISAYDSSAPPWKRNIPLIALMASSITFHREPQVRIHVGRPGVDHDCVEFMREVGSLTGRRASHQSEKPSVARVLDEITKYLGEDS
ncbi:MAG TPA: tungsten formylmethanofuran dehydrogenase [Methylocella sp.]|nr:tungsten formylmethanofuran dehydrogenase [Methylocella sp.]